MEILKCGSRQNPQKDVTSKIQIEAGHKEILERTTVGIKFERTSVGIRRALFLYFFTKKSGGPMKDVGRRKSRKHICKRKS